jgi:O-methyltransferase
MLDFRLPRGWRKRVIKRLIQWPLQRGLVALGRYCNLYLARGLNPSDRVDADRFLKARYWSVATDYVRNATLELLSRELRTVPGSIAEVGVYQGDFAALMHANLPDRPIHLFDTFHGFDSRDRQIDESRKYVVEFHDFSDTSIDAVRRQFPPTAQVHFHPGWFPETAESIPPTEQFALVSLDCDLYQPMMAGLRWFWPRVSPGGFILAHDYNNVRFSGSKQAVREFAREMRATYCPIADWGGTAIVGKPLQ